ncbi:hypothetical protein O6H91_05G092300 [Diphasiastrum complanatum]|uniref:Uncharacterized protein n=2 Tax=Diphasiastrum complanatum TaxID=34168 RepID=A0ACC2DRP3_DIPCM|nr:hypothetical protein O6H91_05G091700 [Diphasiastrum complanatum]KAJ7556661.1 hypothetical protein O6H91_05G092300 [Diphasiastrum complanatum]
MSSSVKSTNPIPYDSGDALNAKIIGASMGVLASAILLITLLHIYIRWVWLNASFRHGHWGRNAFNADDAEPLRSLGLSKAVLDSLPTFTCSKESMAEGMECSVCLCEFHESEEGRLLPRCNHRFHTECIDMWFQTHSSCPLCRASVGDEPPFYAYIGGLDYDPEPSAEEGDPYAHVSESLSSFTESNFMPSPHQAAFDQELGLCKHTSASSTFEHHQELNCSQLKQNQLLPSPASYKSYSSTPVSDGLITNTASPLQQYRRFQEHRLVVDVQCMPDDYSSGSVSMTTSLAIDQQVPKSPLSHLTAIRRILSMREQRVAPFTLTASSPQLTSREC